MGGPTIVDLSKMNVFKSRKGTETSSTVSNTSKVIASSTPTSAGPPHSSTSSSPSAAARRRSSPPSSSSNNNNNNLNNNNSFFKTIFLPSLWALVVFITYKQLSAGPKLWQAAKFVHQKATKLYYQPFVVEGKGHVQESCQLAHDESLGFFDYIQDSDWRYRKQWAKTRQDSLDDHARSDTSNPKMWYIHNYYPFFACPGVSRIGRTPQVGPKYVCDPHRLPHIVQQRNDTSTNNNNNNATNNNNDNGCLVYSVGNPYNFDFEHGLSDLLGDVCQIHIFHSDIMGIERPNIHFHKWNIVGSSSSGADANGKTWQQTVTELGHDSRVIDMMKIDCGGCEWNDYKDWIQFDIRQLLVLTHNPPPHAADMFHGLINAGYVIFAREINIHPWHSRGNNLMVEWSFLKLHPNFTKSE